MANKLKGQDHRTVFLLPGILVKVGHHCQNGQPFISLLLNGDFLQTVPACMFLCRLYLVDTKKRWNFSRKAV